MPTMSATAALSILEQTFDGHGEMLRVFDANKAVSK
jgi:hypothetical protein